MYLTRPVYSIRIPVLCALFLLAGCDGLKTVTPRLTHGPVVGDLGPERAIVWARAEGLATVTCRVVATRSRSLHVATATAECTTERDGTLHFRFEKLHPDWEYEVSFPELSDAPKRLFTTPPEPGRAAPLILAFGGDVGGQGIGRDAKLGLPFAAAIAARTPDVFVGLGDMIYADYDVPSTGKLGNEQVVLGNPLLLTLRSYWTHWRYLHDDAGFAALLAKVPYVAVWDDHEVRNDFSPHDDSGLLPVGRQALFDWNPLAGPPEEPQRLYRSLRYGKHCELFVLDCRSYRDANGQRDDGPERKTMLGKAQREWLLDGLKRSDATWKLIVSSVPLCTPTGDAKKGRDGWSNHESATGYERELVELLRAMQQAGVRQPVLLTTDVHHAEVLRLHPFPDAPDFQPLEVVTGPLQAGAFGRGALDATLAPESLFYLSPDPQPKTFAEALKVWNFGVVTIAADGSLTIEVVDVAGATRFRVGAIRA